VIAQQTGLAPLERSLPAKAKARAGLGRTLATLLPWLVCIGIGIAAYAGSLGAGIMFDAALDLPRASDRGWLEILTSAGGSPYYRPVTLLLWKLCFVILGRNDPLVLHGLSLASHIACGWLVYQLGRRALDGPAGLCAAALFLLFPLSYQVVGFVDSIFHSLAALFVLASAVLYWDARVRHSRKALLGALGTAGLAFLTHESTVALLPILTGIEILLLLRKQPGRLSPVLGWFALELVAFVGVWLAVPRWPSAFKLDGPSIRLNATYFLQGLAYPDAMRLASLPRFRDDAGTVLLAAAVTMLVLLALSALRRRLLVSGLALLWFAGALVPATLLLPWPNYVIDAPRLLYLSSAGIALLWAAALAPSAALRVTPAAALRLAAAATGLACVAAILVESYGFIARRERLLAQGASVVSQLIDTATQPGPDAGRTYVNVPAFIGPKEQDFLLGHSGVTMLPDYFGLDLTVQAARGQRLPITSLSYDDIARPWEEAYGMQGPRAGLNELEQSFRKGGGVYVARYEPGHVRLEYAGRVDRGPATASVAQLGGWVSLEDARARLSGGALLVRLAWRATAPAPGDYTVFVHVLGSGPQPLVQNDGYPMGGMFPPQRWQAGDVIHDERSIPVPPDLEGQVTRVVVGLYDRANPNSRATATDASGARLENDAVPVTLEKA